MAPKCLRTRLAATPDAPRPTRLALARFARDVPASAHRTASFPSLAGRERSHSLFCREAPPICRWSRRDAHRRSLRAASEWCTRASSVACEKFTLPNGLEVILDKGRGRGRSESDRTGATDAQHAPVQTRVLRGQPSVVQNP
jgi:hypothetical protein